MEWSWQNLSEIWKLQILRKLFRETVTRSRTHKSLVWAMIEGTTIAKQIYAWKFVKNLFKLAKNKNWNFCLRSLEKPSNGGSLMPLTRVLCLKLKGDKKKKILLEKSTRWQWVSQPMNGTSKDLVRGLAHHRVCGSRVNPKQLLTQRLRIRVPLNAVLNVAVLRNASARVEIYGKQALLQRIKLIRYLLTLISSLRIVVALITFACGKCYFCII